MGILLWLTFAVIAGSLAKLLMPGPNAGGIVVAVLVGIGGALVGGLIGTFGLGEPSPGFDVRSLLMAIAGTLMLLFSYRCLAMRSNAPEDQRGHLTLRQAGAPSAMISSV
jgi:uncharacterized membrane protein YeaQ/YmgE (transglycosylase-associated protein family)